MKKLYFSLLLLLATTLAWADIPKGKTIYLDVSQHWCCHKSYYLYLSRDNKSHKMAPVEGNDGVYKYVTTGSTQDNLRFCYSDKETSDEVNQNMQPSTNDVYYNASKPYFTITSEAGEGTWASEPSATGSTALTDVQATLKYNCAEEKYNILLTISFDGAPCGMRIATAAPATEKIVRKPHTPYAYVIESLSVSEGQTVQLIVELYSDVACTQKIDTKTLSLTVPGKNCETTHDPLVVCKGETVILSSSVDAEVYLWLSDDPAVDSLTTRSVTIPTENLGTYTYSVEAHQTIINAANNLMIGGAFESMDGFESKYAAAGGTDENAENPSNMYPAGTTVNYYASHQDASNLFALVGNTAEFASSYAEITPHGGDYLGLFDAGSDGYAWMASTQHATATKENPDLWIQKDSIYYFSFYVAHPNTPSESDHPAILQFHISYQPEDTIPLGEPVTISTEDNEWHLHCITWKAPKTSVNVMIGVKNLNTYAGVGNDFCLDDIMFQKVSYNETKVAFTDHFEVTVRNCEDCPDIPTTPKDTTVCADEMPYTWHDHKFTYATETWTETIISKLTGCDSLIICYTLNTKDCTIPCEVQIYRKWNDFLFVDNSDSIYTSFQWYCDAKAIDGATGQYYRIPSPSTSSEYYVILNGSIESCHTTFSDATPSSEEYPFNKEKTLIAKRIYDIFANFTITVYTFSDGSVETEKQLLY